jgi:hypothetical protein
MPPLQFAEACRFPDITEISNRKYASKTCNEATATFSDNILRCNGIVFTPVYAWMVADDWRFSTDKAALEIAGAIEPDDIAGEAKEKAVYLRTIELFHAMQAASTSEERRSDFNRAKNSLDAIIATSIPLYRAAAESLLKSVIIQAWTSFEVLSEDLINGAKAEYPTFFSGVDFSTFRFRSRKRIRAAYRITFADDLNICAAVNHDSVDALALLRNVLVHKAGIADHDFTDGIPTSSLLSPFSGVKEGQPIEINGTVMRSIVDSSFNCGYALIIAVNNWLNRP